MGLHLLTELNRSLTIIPAKCTDYSLILGYCEIIDIINSNRVLLESAIPLIEENGDFVMNNKRRKQSALVLIQLFLSELDKSIQNYSKLRQSSNTYDT